LYEKVNVKTYKTLVLLVVLHGCETWYVMVREESRLRFFLITLPRRIFGSQSEDVTRRWIKLRDEDLCSSWSGPNIIRVIKSRSTRWVGHVARMREVGNAYKIFVGNPEGKIRFGTCSHVWGIILKWTLGKRGLEMLIELVWLGTGTGDCLLLTL
jgi:hypothetical protein